MFCQTDEPLEKIDYKLDTDKQIYIQHHERMETLLQTFHHKFLNHHVDVCLLGKTAQLTGK